MELNQKQVEWLAANKLVFLDLGDGDFAIQSKSAHNFGPKYYRIVSYSGLIAINLMYTKTDCAGPYTNSQLKSQHKTLCDALKALLKLIG